MQFSKNSLEAHFQFPGTWSGVPEERTEKYGQLIYRWLTHIRMWLHLNVMIGWFVCTTLST